ncbi:Protein NRT1/ PTR FAMILY 8.5 [Rhynchospora pubera]|uniref:Protein NRT1/ PTR FAMILY 8.5 n=1 Tax=Rhynchospora pubera TaxID=906938 RepID=A0AAV8ERG6_9POAL|nr:Protein NRT1/ PTR FAMILY 8.5 [Rhynchospora pubera]
MEHEQQSLLIEAEHEEFRKDYTGDGSVNLKGLPILKHETGNWRACYFILGTECCEKLALYGIAKNLVSYLTRQLHERNVVAARNVLTWQGTCYFTPLLGALVADSYLGKFWTIAAFSTLYFIGLVMLTISALVPGQSSQSQTVGFYFGLYLVALGAGGIKPCVITFGADQFDDNDPIERSERASFFNWASFMINIGALLSGIILVYIQDNYGWGLGFGIPTLFMGLDIVSFFIGTGIYRFQRPGGSPVIRICQVIVASCRKWTVQLPLDASLLYELPGNSSFIKGSRKLDHTSELRYLDKAAVIISSDIKLGNGNPLNPWRLCTVTQVEELKLLVRLFPIWATTIVFYAVGCQSLSMFIEQGMVLDKQVRSFTIPPASLSTFDVISLLILVPIYDKILVPVVRRFTGKERGFTQLQRMGIGLFLSILTMVSAALVEMKRLEIARELNLVHEKVEIPMSILWQIPQYCLDGTSQVFTLIGQAEFFYSEAPDAMRCLCAAFSLLSSSLGGYLSSFLLTLVSYCTSRGGEPGWIPDNLNEGHLDRYFLLIAGLSAVNLLIFVWCALRYTYRTTV